MWSLSYVGGQTIDLKNVGKRNSRPFVPLPLNASRRRGVSLDEKLVPNLAKRRLCAPAPR
jgi:hypothetical protein